MEAPDQRQLPIRLELAPAESGLGFALRALRANGVAFDRGVQWLRLERHRPLAWQDIRQIAWALNVDADHWGGRVVVRDHGGKGWVRLAGQRFRRHIASNRLYAKLCPQCVRERGIVRLSWLLRATVGCPWHGYSLICSCHRCGEGIGWDRPDVDICRCGHPFKANGEAPELESDVMAWLCWLEAAVSPAAPQRPVPAAFRSMPGAIEHLSVDGSFRIVEALGLRAGPNDSVRSALAKCAVPRVLGAAIARGLDRLRFIEANLTEVPSLASVVNQEALIQVARDYAAPVDHTLAWWLLHALRSGIDPGTTRAGLRPKGQLPLFLA
ncbi:TniQ family protein [Pelomonas sp. Root1237]|uniref:TniQ family protein n=1 Tax=Pelomonas sp. Root1237 TaxID=1736434 RepID=UPI0006FA250F|nr:TniQ family protein [Pelomonas sp. Root1237]KQV88065.1 hypothetical protein ASC91_14630 [Pelomonas sp. Root1237]